MSTTKRIEGEKELFFFPVRRSQFEFCTSSQGSRRFDGSNIVLSIDHTPRSALLLLPAASALPAASLLVYGRARAAASGVWGLSPPPYRRTAVPVAGRNPRPTAYLPP